MMELNKIYCGDSEELLSKLDDNSIDLVVTSPPYDNLRKYQGCGDGWCETKFKRIADELYRVLKRGGVIIWNVNDKTENGSKTLTSFRQAIYFQELGLNANDIMIWTKNNPLPQVKQPRYQDAFEYMFVFSKGTPKTFNPIMVPCKCAGMNYDSTAKNMDGESGRHRLTYKVNSEKIKPNVWEIPVSKNETEHPAVFPYQIPHDHIITWTNEGDIVLDPFMGSGTTALAAKDLHRNYIGFELNENYVDICNKRLSEHYVANSLI